MKILFLIFTCLLLTIAYSGDMVLADTQNVEDRANPLMLIRPLRGAGLKYFPNEIIVKFRETVSDAIEVQIAEGSHCSNLMLGDSLKKLHKKYKLKSVIPLFKDFKENRLRLKTLVKKDKALLTKKERHILRRLKRADKRARVPELDRIYRLEIETEPGQSLEEVVSAYNNNPDVEYAELNYIVSTCKTPNDPLYPIQWALNNIGQMYPESGSYNHSPGTVDCDIDAPEAWDIKADSSEVIVAVIDTGVDYAHRDLQANMWVNQTELNGTEGVDDDGNGYIDDIYGYDFCNSDADPADDNGHGTHCSGIISAGGNNSLDIAGVCWNAKIMALKFLASDGRGSSANASESLYYAVENGADIASNSWGGGFHSQAVEDAVNYAHSQGVFIVAAAGNEDSSSAQYPAYYDNVLSVAATNSNDERAPFSTYGDWVDIAAPGVDILSLRAQGTSRGTVYDAYTTILSGTSMACPHVSGACALMLSIYPGMQIDEFRDILDEITDPITPEVCASGRLNLYKALQAIEGFITGVASLHRDVYSCSDTVQIMIRDLDLIGQGTQEVTVSTDGEDFETVFLTETGSPSAKFTGTISTDSGKPEIQDGILQVSDGETITATYYDANDETGSPATVIDTGIVDCRHPEIFNVHIEDIKSGAALVVFDTDEPTTGRVHCDKTCGGTYTITAKERTLAKSHSIYLTKLSPEMTYYFAVEATDAAGNVALDDNNGVCYSFVTAPPLQVPGQYGTIQSAVDAAYDYEVIVVADGTYTGEGNRDIDLRGKSITVKSENGPENCIIDCHGAWYNQHRGFFLHNSEDVNSVIDGFTITGGYTGHDGGGICCIDSSPTISNCIISENFALYGGAIHCTAAAGPIIKNCTITKNSAVRGAGIACIDSNPTISNCIISFNSIVGKDSGGGVYCFGGHTVINKCIILGNEAGNQGGGILNMSRAGPCTLEIVNSIIALNTADLGAGFSSSYYANVTVRNCTIVGNTTSNQGGSIYIYWYTNLSVNNCILWDNSPQPIQVSYCQPPLITYSNIQGGWEGQGNIDIDPCFVDAGYWADVNDPNIIVEPNDPNAVWIDGDYHLWEDSPCINTGDPDYVAEPDETDLDSLPRVIAGRIDMGAYEFNPPIQAEMKFTPKTLNCKSKGNWLKAHFVLPQGLSPEDVDLNEPAFAELSQRTIDSEYIKLLGNDGPVRLEIAFDRQAFCELLMDDSIVTDDNALEITVVGYLTTGRYFYGCDTVRIRCYHRRGWWRRRR